MPATLLQPREEFISRLLSMLKAQPGSSAGATTSSAEDFDSWEDRVSDEVINWYFSDTGKRVIGSQVWCYKG